MRLLAIAAAAILTGAPAPAPDVAPVGDMPVLVPGEPMPGNCPETAASLARREGGRLRPRTLGELPGADAYSAVWRTVNGCEAPIVIGYDIGGHSPARYLEERR